MALANTPTTLNGFFKESYAKDLKNLIPDGIKLLPMIPFSKKEAILGSLYHQPVILGHEHGVTFAGATDDAFTLSDAVAGATKDAQVQGTQLVLRSVLGLAAASRAAAGDKAAFMGATKFLVKNMIQSVAKKLEIEMLYGQMGYASLDVVEPIGETVIAIPAAEWAPGIWAGAENMPIEIRLTASPFTVKTTAGTYITAVDFENKTITLSAGLATATVGSTAGDTIWHKSAYGNEFAGIHKIITNTGTLFNISASTYSLFKGNSYAAGGALSLAKLQDAISKAIAKGLDNDVVVIVNPDVWVDLMNEQSALRVIDSSYSKEKSESGAKKLEFHSQNGTMEIVPSIYCKVGFAYVVSPDDFMRIGSTDVTFNRPGKEGEFFRDLDSQAGYELRCYCDQALFCAAPAKQVIITGITT
jgi:hypothetical protein